MNRAGVEGPLHPLFRIGLALLLAFDTMTALLHSEFLLNEGLLPLADLYTRESLPPGPTLYAAMRWWPYVYILLLSQLFLSAALALGIRSKGSCLALTVLVASAHNRNPHVVGLDDHGATLLLVGVFFALGETSQKTLGPSGLVGRILILAVPVGLVRLAFLAPEVVSAQHEALLRGGAGLFFLCLLVLLCSNTSRPLSWACWFFCLLVLLLLAGPSRLSFVLGLSLLMFWPLSSKKLRFRDSLLCIGLALLSWPVASSLHLVESVFSKFQRQQEVVWAQPEQLTWRVVGEASEGRPFFEHSPLNYRLLRYENSLALSHRPNGLATFAQSLIVWELEDEATDTLVIEVFSPGDFQFPRLTATVNRPTEETVWDRLPHLDRKDSDAE